VERDTLKQAIAETLCSVGSAPFDTSWEDFADALLGGPLAGLLDENVRLTAELAALREDAADQEDRMFDDLTRQLHTINTLNAFAGQLATAIGWEERGEGWVEKAGNYFARVRDVVALGAAVRKVGA
jgi:hypothetical protein